MSIVVPARTRAAPGPDYSHEAAAHARGLLRVAGVDEVGRGPLAGPVTAAAVILDVRQIPPGLNDSKVLTPARRKALCALLLDTAEVSVGHASVQEIDDINILRAAHLAMMRALAGLRQPPDHVLIDGNMIPRGCTYPAQCLIGGDALCLSIAAASIVAKVHRDAIMVDLAQQHPGYGWETNAGYASLAHRTALQDLGVTPHHRRSFKPVYNILYQ